jgi:hypothetical protein
MAAITWEMSVAPEAAPTLTLTSRVRGDPGELAVVLAGDDAAHVGAVPVGVQVAQVRRLGLERQVGPVDDLAGAGQVLHRDHAGVDQGHVHPAAGDAGGPQVVGADHLGRVLQRAQVGGGVEGGGVLVAVLLVVPAVLAALGAKAGVGGDGPDPRGLAEPLHGRGRQGGREPSMIRSWRVTRPPRATTRRSGPCPAPVSSRTITDTVPDRPAVAVAPATGRTATSSPASMARASTDRGPWPPRERMVPRAECRTGRFLSLCAAARGFLMFKGSAPAAT